MSTELDAAARILSERAHGRVQRGGAIGPLTSYRLGGPADILLEAAGVEDLEALAVAVRETGVPVLVVGRGSNMLVSDRGFDGIALRLGAVVRRFDIGYLHFLLVAATRLRLLERARESREEERD